MVSNDTNGVNILNRLLMVNKIASHPRYNLHGKNEVFEINLINDYGLDGGIGALRKDTVLDSDIDHKVLRNPMASAQLLRLMKDPFSGGCEIVSDNNELADMANDLIKQTKFFTMISRAHAYAYAYGAGFLYLDLIMRTNEGKDSQVANIPRNRVITTKDDDKKKHYDFSKVIRRINVFSRKRVDGPEIDPESGEYTHWNVYKQNVMYKKEKIHSDRMFYLQNWYLSSTWRGRSAFEPQFDALNDFEDASVTNVETLIKNASGYMVLKLPISQMVNGDLPKIGSGMLSQSDLDKAEEIVTNPHVKKSAIIDKAWELEAVDMDGGVDPTPYLQHIKQSISVGGMIPTIIMSGAEAGQLTGYEYVVKLYNKWVTIQRKIYEEHTEDLISRFQKWKLFPPGTFWIKWGPIDTPTIKEEAEFGLKNATAQNMIVSAITGMSAKGWEIMHRGGVAYWVKETVDKRVVGIPIVGIDIIELDDIDPKKSYLEDIGRKYGFKKEPPTPPVIPGEPSPQDEQNAKNASYQLWAKNYRLTKEEKDKLIKEWGIVPILDRLIPKYTTRTNGAIENAFDKYTDKIKAILSKNGINSINAELPPQVIEILMDSVDDIKFDKKGEIEKSLEDAMQEALEQGWNQFNDNLGIDADWDPGSEFVRNYFLTNIKPLSNRMSVDLGSSLIDAIADGIKRGYGYQKIYESMEGAKGKYTKDSTGKVIHRVVHNAVNSAKLEAGKQSGYVSDQKMGIYVTQGDSRVRPEHALREGNVYTPDELEDLLSEWACRCTWVPQLAIERLRGSPLTREEIGAPLVGESG